MHETREIAIGVHWVGVRDWDRRIFDSLIPLPAGTTYNSYLVSGRDKVALIDTVNPGFEEELKGKLEQLGSWGKIDYLIMNHAEPDHASAIPFILERSPKARLVLTEKSTPLKMGTHGPMIVVAPAGSPTMRRASARLTLLCGSFRSPNMRAPTGQAFTHAGVAS
jgi:flavorubredoxin